MNLEKTTLLELKPKTKPRGRGVGYIPTPEEIIKLRGAISQSTCSKMIYVRQSRWSDYENGKVRMHPSMWELFCIKVKKHGKKKSSASKNIKAKKLD